MMSLTLLRLPDTYAVAQLPADAAIPEWATRGLFFSITRTTDELSIVCREKDVPAEVRAGRGWRCLRVAGKLDFIMVGILRSVIDPLADFGIAVFAVSTFDTDYFLVKQFEFGEVVDALSLAGHSVFSSVPADSA